MRVLFLVSASVGAALLTGDLATAQERTLSPDQTAQCAPHVNAITVVRERISAGRKALTGDEVDCAFEEFTANALSRHCTQVKSAADVAKLRTWNGLPHAWDALNRLRLQLRQTEERLGIQCESE
jgi:hypothetical protein